MAARKRKKGKGKPTSPAAGGGRGSTDAAPSPPARRRILIGTLLLAVATAAAAVLALSHWKGLSLPGCGFDSACGRAQASAWGTVPGTFLPTSHLGLAYFLALAIGWLVGRGSVAPALRQVIRVGAVGSFLLILVMIKGGYPCPYCLLVHFANLGFCFLVERRATVAPDSTRPLLAAGTVFAVLLLALGLLEASTERRVEAVQEAALQQSLEQVSAAGDSPADGLGTGRAAEPFTGRYRKGPEEAAIRIVVISDYQCPDCKNIDRQVRTILAERDDVSVSGKHFPFNTDCNPRVPRTMHPNACMAARAAETAGLLGGDEAYWKMHEWLFDVGGRFESTAELAVGATRAGLDVRALTRKMLDGSVDSLIRADVQEAVDLGLHFTPMVFINGVELKGVFARDALLRAVDTLSKSAPARLAASADAPPPAGTKYVEDWQQGRRLPPQPDSSDWTLGPPEAAVRIVLWGDYTSPITKELDGRLRDLLPSLADASYSPRHYPMDQDCNDTIRSTLQPRGCAAARAVEAAGVVGGHAGYWAMHEQVLTQAQGGSEEELWRAASAAGLGPAAVFAAMASPSVSEAIREDASSGARLGARGFPALVVNDRLVPRWRRQGEDILRRILEAAESERRD